MKFGLALPHSGPIAGVDAICRVAELAEAAGFDALLVHDHIHYDTEWLGHRTSGLTQPHADITPNLYESLITLAWVARATTTVRLVTAVLVLPLRDPRVLARQLVTLQALARGRLTLGVGSGDYPGDYRVMEIEYRRKAALMRDYLDALAVLLPGGGPTSRAKRSASIAVRSFPKSSRSRSCSAAASEPPREPASTNCSSRRCACLRGAATGGCRKDRPR